ncbi:MAG: class D beta-lactamase [Chitinophagales bacterium]|nr:class D beta-lactamase [Chitinophagales bacterium]
MNSQPSQVLEHLQQFRFACLLVGAVITINSFSCNSTGDHHPELKKYFDAYKVKGCFEVFDSRNSQFIDYNPDRCSQRFIPASTFNIFISLVGLQTGALPDENHVIQWDSIVRIVPAWNHNQSLQKAFRNSTLWYFQEVARRITAPKMQQYLNLLHYGNKTMDGPVDSLWLSGGLRISCDEQIEFIRDFYRNTYHFSPESVNRVKKMLILEEVPDYKLSGKTGWTEMKGNETVDSKLNVGWFVGYVEKGGDVYFFATNYEAPEFTQKNFELIGKEITIKCLKELGIIL